MARSTVVQREVVEALPVTFVNTRVVASEMQSVVPKGFRVATDDECALMSLRDPAFREDLRRNDAAWTSRVGLETSGPREIDSDGKRFSTNDLRSLPLEKRTYDYSGNGPVAVGYDGILSELWFRAQSLAADRSSSVEARVAIVPDQTQAGRGAAAQQIVLPGTTIEETKELAAALRKISERDGVSDAFNGDIEEVRVLKRAANLLESLEVKE